jgi:hypothetical protein
MGASGNPEQLEHRASVDELKFTGLQTVAKIPCVLEFDLHPKLICPLRKKLGICMGANNRFLYVHLFSPITRLLGIGKK